MASAEQLKALVRSFADGDDTRFLSVAMQVAAVEAKLGHTKLAEELRALIDEAKTRGASTGATRQASGSPRPTGELAGLLVVTQPRIRFADMVLTEPVRERLVRVLHEQRQQQKLRHFGFKARNRALLVGPPGSGKTMTAAALAGELGLPLLTIQLDGVLTKFLGESAAKLRLVFDMMRTTRGVYLFDEFDSIGTQRATVNEVGEMRRVLNSFLQFVEADDSDSLVVAATNNPQSLDEALFRRFDDVIEYTAPTAALAKQLVESRLGPFAGSAVTSRVVEATAALSYAELGRATDDAVKLAILGDRNVVDEEALLATLTQRGAPRTTR